MSILWRDTSFTEPYPGGSSAYYPEQIDLHVFGLDFKAYLVQ